MKDGSKREQMKVIEPQPGYQLNFLSSSADIVIGGGAAGVGKTYSLLLEFLRHINTPQWGGVIFRRTTPQIRNEGGLWDTSKTLYPLAKASPRETALEWDFPKGPTMKFSHLEYEKNIYDWQGAQIPYLGFDELTHFSKKMFFYLLTRSRSTCGVTPYVRATCNPDPSSWVAEFIEWWIDQSTGFPIADRIGKIIYLFIDGDKYVWGNTVTEVIDQIQYVIQPLVEASGIEAKHFVKSVTFIGGNIYDNKKLLEANPEYLANLASQDEATRSALLYGNWKIVVSANDIYNYSQFIGMFVNQYSVRQGRKYITADIALKGSDKFVVGVWHGFEMIDILIMAKSDGGEIIAGITGMAEKHHVQNSDICFDSDGVGGFIDGFIEGAIGFTNNGTPENDENYQNLKTQCYYKSGDRVNRGDYIISEEVGNRMYDENMTVRQRFVFERKAIMRDKADFDGKLRILPKDKMKILLNGQSPDMMDMFMMRERFELSSAAGWNAE